MKQNIWFGIITLLLMACGGGDDSGEDDGLQQIDNDDLDY